MFPNFWLGDVPGDEAKLLFRSFVRCDYEYAYPYRFPDAELHRQQPLPEADGLIVVSNEATLSPSAQTMLAQAGIVASVYQSREISIGNVRYYCCCWTSLSFVLPESQLGVTACPPRLGSRRP
jgi:hypothetical protein